MILIGNGTLIARDKNNTVLSDGAVAVENDKILKIGKCQDLKQEFAQAEWVDAHGGLIMPGWINCHNHIYSAFARGLSIKNYNPSCFYDILKDMWWAIDSKLDLEMIKYSAYVVYLECIKNGVTTVFDHHASYLDIADSLFTIADAADELGVRTNLCFEISDRNGQDAMKQAVKESVRFARYAKEKNSDMLGAMMGLHASFTVSDQTLAYCNEQKPDGVGYHVHIAEGFSDVTDCLHRYGQRVVNRLFDHQILGEQSLAVHCIHINKQEMDVLKQTNTPVIHNPESNMGNAVGCGAVVDMFRRGLTLGLGTDGYTNDMMESYKVGNLIHKHNLCDPTVGYNELPAMLFENNAKIANRHINGETGTLQPGAYADIIVAEYDPFTPLEPDNLNAHILFGMSGKNVVTTMVNGRVSMKDRQLLHVDEKEIYRKAQQTARRLWNNVNQ